MLLINTFKPNSIGVFSKDFMYYITKPYIIIEVSHGIYLVRSSQFIMGYQLQIIPTSLFFQICFKSYIQAVCC